MGVNEPKEPEPTRAGLSSDAPVPTAAPSARAAAVLAKIGPEAMKQYRVDVCYHGTFALRWARDDYVASLGGHRPGPGHIPAFVDLPGSELERGLERDARACTAAVALRDTVDFGDIDTAIAVCAPFALELAKHMNTARKYYRSGEHANDGFARGGELHDAMIAGFKQLDALHDRLGAAIAARRKSHPPNVSDEGERVGRAAIEDARTVLLRAVAPQLDGKAFDAAVRQLGKSAQASRAWESSNPNDPWSQIVNAPLEAFRALVEAPRPPGARRLDSPAVYQMVRAFVFLIETRQRAITRIALRKPNGGKP